MVKASLVSKVHLIEILWYRVRTSITAKIMPIFITHQLLVIGSGYLAKVFFPVGREAGSWQVVLTNLSHWDGRWYMRIATEGYTLKSAAFFPLYPVLIKKMTSLGFTPAWAGAVISNVSFLLVCMLLYYLVRLDTDEKTALRAVWYLALFPTGFFFSAIYTESLFLALVLACFILARQRKWGSASFIGLLASATRNTGVLLVFPLVVIYLQDIRYKLGRVRWDSLYLGLVPVGLVLYMLYLWKTFGNPFSFLAAQHYWKRSLDLPWANLYLAWENVISNIVMVRNLTDLMFTIFALVLTAVGARKLRPEYLLYLALGLFVPLTSRAPHAGLLSMPRFMLVLFPLYIIMGDIFQRKSTFRLTIAVSALVMVLFTIMFAYSQFVA